jgi:hypothetical protein
MRFEIEPHRGVLPITFGMQRSYVAAAMGQIGGGSPVRRFQSTDCFFSNAFQVSFNKSESAYFIEVCNNTDLLFLFGGKDVFDMPGEELLQDVILLDQPDPALSTSGYSYTFPNLIMTLWELDSQYDHKGGQRRPMFGAIGIGTEEYLNRIRDIEAKRKAREAKIDRAKIVADARRRYPQFFNKSDTAMNP